MTPFRVAVSPLFRRTDGRWNFPHFDLAPLAGDARFAVEQIPPGTPLTAVVLDGFHGLILAGDPVPPDALPAGSTLLAISRFGVGYDKVPVQACTQAGVALTITPDAVRRPVAVAALTLVLALAGKVLVKDRLVREGPAGFARRTDHMGRGLVGRTLASIGLGNIAAEMFRLAAPFGMRHIAHDPWASAAVAREAGVALVELETVFAEADFLCVHCPLNDATRHLVNAERIARMKPEAYLVNTARGPVVDQVALEAALRAGRIAGAGLDVQDPEPPPAGASILELDNVIFAPHALSWTDQGFEAIGAGCIDPMRALAEGRVPAHIVNADVLGTASFQAKLAQRRATGA